MPTTHPSLAVTTREITGKKVSHLRRQGLLPAVLFGHGAESVPATIDLHQFEQLRRHTGANALIDVSLDGQKAHRALIHSVQVHPVTRAPLHVDLFLVRMTEELTVDVPVVLTGTSFAVDKLGGTLFHALDVLKVKALPDHLPQSFEVAVDSLADFDATLHVRDVAIPSGVTLLTDPDEVLCKVLAPRIEEVAAPAAEEAEEGEEAAAGEAEAGTEEAAPAPSES